MKRTWTLSAGLLVLFMIGCGGDDNPADPGGTTENTIQITSISPAHESVGNDQMVDLSITFDQPVTQMGALLIPGFTSLNEEWFFRSEDSTTYSRSIALDEDQVYQLIIYGAVGADGETYLSEVEMVVFTTGESIHDGSISGTIVTPGAYSPDGTVIFLVNAMYWSGTNYYFSEENSMEDNVTALGIVNNSSGVYRIDYVPKGHYYLYAFKNTISDGNAENDENMFGWYSDPDESVYVSGYIDVTANSNPTGIDFPLFKGNSFFGG